MQNASSNPTTTRGVVTALGGTKAVASLTNSKYSAVANWVSGGQFPANTFIVLNSALVAIGKSAPATLWKMKFPSEAL